MKDAEYKICKTVKQSLKKLAPGRSHSHQQLCLDWTDKTQRQQRRLGTPGATAKIIENFHILKVEYYSLKHTSIY